MVDYSGCHLATKKDFSIRYLFEEQGPIKVLYESKLIMNEFD